MNSVLVLPAGSLVDAALSLVRETVDTPIVDHSLRIPAHRRLAPAPLLPQARHRRPSPAPRPHRPRRRTTGTRLAALPSAGAGNCIQVVDTACAGRGEDRAERL